MQWLSRCVSPVWASENGYINTKPRDKWWDERGHRVIHSSNRSGGKAVIRALNHRLLPINSTVWCRNYGGRLINRGARSLTLGRIKQGNFAEVALMVEHLTLTDLSTVTDLGIMGEFIRPKRNIPA